MIINHNISAMNSYKNVAGTQTDVSKSLEKLSSGIRINRAGDDAAGLSISEKMRSQVKGLDMAAKNALDAISFIQTAEGALNETHSVIQRMRELAVQSASDTNTTADRVEIQKEVNQLRQEVDKIAYSTEFNTKKLLSGSFSSTALRFHVGPGNAHTVSLNISSMAAKELGISGAQISLGLNVTSRINAESAISTIDSAITKVAAQRSKLGAIQNRLEHSINNLRVSSENLQGAESRIRDVDMAKEIVDYAKNMVIVQSGTAMLAQANSNPLSIMQLIKTDGKEDELKVKVH